MSIQDLLGNMGGSSQGKASPRMSGGLPAYSAKDAKNAKLISEEMSTIDELVRSSGANWEKMGAAKALINVKKALEEVEAAEKEFNDAMEDANTTLEERAVLYEKLAKVKNKQVETQNQEVKAARESQGMWGRSKNVMMDMAKNWKTLGLGVIFKGLEIGAKDAAQSFDILAESSQAANMDFGELAATTGTYAVQIELASVKAMQFGVSAEDSTKAFAKLTKTYGGTKDVVDDLGSSWTDIVQIAKVSGLGMEGFTDLATQGMVRLGESMDEAKQNAVDISTATAGMNARFGDGSANAKEFSSAVTSLAYAQGFYNQSTKLTIDTLSREVNMQLALGKSREAALQTAKSNVEMAGETNIIGVQKMSAELTSGYAGAEDKEAWLAENVGSGDTGQFGADTDVIRHMLESGETNLFALQEMLTGSSYAQSKMLLEIQKAAANNDVSTMLGLGVEHGKARAMISRQSLTTSQLDTIGSGDTDESKAMIKKLFGEGPLNKQQQAFVDKSRGGEYGSKGEQFEAYYKLADADTSDAMAETGAEGQTVNDWLTETKVAGWFNGVVNAIGAVSGVLSKILLAAGAAGTALGIGGGAAGISALLGGGAVAASIATAATVALGAAAVGAGAFAIYKGMENVTEKKAAGESFLGLEDEEGGFIGSRGSSVLASTAAGAATGAVIGSIVPVFGTAIGALVGGAIGAMASGGADLLADGPEDIAADEEAARAVVAEGAAAAEAATPPPTAPVQDTPVSDGPVGAKGKDQKSRPVAIGTGTISGKSLIFEVTNWDQIHAQTVNDAA